ncbi:MAG: ATP-binding cassette domain-containing protein [Gammaproteobacteria bacterium]
MIEVDKLTKTFSGAVAVRNVSLRVAAGELLVLVGGSGSGKTTTLKMINRLIEPDSGTVLIDGVNVAAIEGHILRRRIGYVFQKVGLFPHMTVEANIATPLRLLDQAPQGDDKRVRQRVARVLELMELPASFASRYPAELSGGEQQRVGVARALAAEPRVMLLDEPFGALDPLTRDRLQQSFMEVRRQLGLTAVFVTHDMVEALLIADRIAVLHNGALLQVGTPQELLQSPADPYVEQMLKTPRRQARALDDLLTGLTAGRAT